MQRLIEQLPEERFTFDDYLDDDGVVEGYPHLCIAMHRENDRLVVDYFGMHRFDWSDASEFQIPHGETIRLLRSCGFEIEDLLELRAHEGATTHADWITLEWARRWPSVEVWKARKRG